MSPTERFSSRVENYLKYRPHYPREIVRALREQTGLMPKQAIADIGSGTGFSAELFLENGNLVYGVEPNKEMRDAGERHLASHKNFRNVDGTAEATTLPDQSIDYIIAGQAFHWFDFELAYTEFKRILKPNGWLVIVWNDRQTDSTPFLRDYEQLLLDFGTDYTEINHRNFDSKKVWAFFRGKDVAELAFDNNIMMDYAGLEGRLLSSSYVPAPGEPNYDAMIHRLRDLFANHAVGGTVDMRYTTLLYYGQL